MVDGKGARDVTVEAPRRTPLSGAAYEGSAPDVGTSGDGARLDPDVSGLGITEESPDSDTGDSIDGAGAERLIVGAGGTIDMLGTGGGPLGMAAAVALLRTEQ